MVARHVRSGELEFAFLLGLATVTLNAFGALLDRYRPVDPCPLAPRSVEDSSFVSTSTDETSRPMTNCAIRSPCLITRGGLDPTMCIVTKTSPR